MRRLVVLTIVGLFLAGSAGIALAVDGPEIGIAGAFSWNWDLNEPSLGTPTLNTASTSNLETGRNSFNIDLVELTAHGNAAENISYEASVMFGDLAFFSGDAGSSSDVGLHTANVTFPVGPVSVNVGRRATAIGYESLQPWANPHISRSFAWNEQPINHDGFSLGYDGGSWSGSVGMANAYSVAQAGAAAPNDGDFSKAVTADFSIAIAGWDASIAGIHSKDAGADQTNINLIFEGDLGPVQAALEYNYFDKELGGPSFLAAATTADIEADTIALYFGADLDCCWGWAVRFEYDDIDTSPGSFGVPTSPSGELYGVTLTGTWHIADGTDLRFEYRHNEANDLTVPGGAADKVFADDSTSGFDDSQDIIALQLVMF